MRSAHVEAFNHDAEAEGYDADVLNEDHPIRAGYAALLAWLSSFVTPSTNARVLDLGTGTGNLAALLPRVGELDCVDISKNMLQLAEAKLGALRLAFSASFQQSDLLEYFDTTRPPYDWIVSSYAIHHLTDAEKDHLFACVYESLKPGGVALLGDLMFENPRSKASYLSNLRRSSRASLAEEIEEEFFWDLSRARSRLTELGFRVSVARFSDLSFGVRAVRPTG